MKIVQETGVLEPQFREIVNNAIDKTAFVDVVTGGANEEFSIEHGMGTIPIGWLVISQDGAVATYKSMTPWDTNFIYLKSTASGVGIRVLVF